MIVTSKKVLEVFDIVIFNAKWSIKATYPNNNVRCVFSNRYEENQDFPFKHL